MNVLQDSYFSTLQETADAINKASSPLALCEASDEAKAVCATAQAAMNGDINAQFQLAEYYFWGNEVLPMDVARAYFWYYKCCEQGHLQARYMCAYIRFFGLLDGTRLPDAALTLAKPLAELGHPDAQYLCGHIFMEERNQSTAFMWFLSAAEQGHPYAAFQCGNCYDNGIGVLEDKEAAFSWYLRAAEQGVAEAQYRCSIMYLDGIGVEKDEKKAFDMCFKAALQGNMEAMELYKDLYEFDVEPYTNRQIGFFWSYPTSHSQRPNEILSWKGNLVSQPFTGDTTPDSGTE